jgi:hypothetical protein
MNLNVIILVTLIFVIPEDCFAYLDLGTGSYVLQVMAATAVAGLFVIRQYWQRIKKAVSRKLRGKRSDDQL